MTNFIQNIFNKPKTNHKNYTLLLPAISPILLIKAQILDIIDMSVSPRIVKNLFINGQFVRSVSGKMFDVINPADESVLAQIDRGSTEDIDNAVKAANNAFHNGPWSRMDPSDRARCMFKLADLIQKNAGELGDLEAINNGKPASIARAADIPLAYKCIRYYAGWADKITGQTIHNDGPFTTYTKKQPVGVVGQIIPWNFPLLMMAWKLGPALATGCTTIVKTAEQTPLTALRTAELIKDAGFPDGVVNIVSGFGDIGQHLSRHPDVDKIAFTGSSEVGYNIMRNSHVKRLKRVTLQLGGKSANIITKNADMQKALSQSTMSLFFNAGQCCIAGSRTYVHQSIYDEYVKKAVENVSSIKLGNPLQASTDQGPLVSKEQFDRVMDYIEKGKKEGAKLMTGGKRHGDKGYFVQPTIFADVQDDMQIAKEEIFGPVMCIFKFKDNQEVIQRANNSVYGLGAGVVSENASELQFFIDRFKAGTVYANCYNVFQSCLPFGGYKDSGIGRELGEQGLKNYLETKTVIVSK